MRLPIYADTIEIVELKRERELDGDHFPIPRHRGFEVYVNDELVAYSSRITYYPNGRT